MQSVMIVTTMDVVKMIPIRIVIKAMIAAQVVYGNHFTE